MPTAAVAHSWSKPVQSSSSQRHTTTSTHNAESTLNTIAQQSCAANLMHARIHTKLQRLPTFGQPAVATAAILAFQPAAPDTHHHDDTKQVWQLLSPQHTGDWPQGNIAAAPLLHSSYQHELSPLMPQCCCCLQHTCSCCSGWGLVLHCTNADSPCRHWCCCYRSCVAPAAAAVRSIHLHAILLAHVLHKLVHEVGPGTSIIIVAEVGLDLLHSTQHSTHSHHTTAWSATAIG